MVGSSRLGGFLASVHPLLERGDCRTLLSVLDENWPPATLRALLKCDTPAIQQTAARCLALTGSTADADALAELLRDGDSAASQEAEDALWSVWMRAGSPRANQRLAQGADYLRDERADEAIACLRDLTDDEPAFAEAHHQLALALHSAGRLEEAAAEYRRACELNPRHFAAWCGLGHVCSEQHNFAGALENYRAALHIHPGLAEIREVVPQLEAAVARRSVA